MAWTPRTTTSSKDGHRFRIYTRPHFGTYEGKLQALHELVTVTRDPATGSYRVTLPNGTYLAWTPRIRPTARLARAVVTPTHFGDVLDSLGDKVLDYDVSYSRAEDVEYTPAGWRFKAIADVPIGMFFGDLARRFPGKVTHKSDGRVRVDLADVPADKNGEWNLDPSPYSVDANNTGYAYSWTSDIWESIWGSADSVMTGGFGSYANALDNDGSPSQLYQINQAFWRFDTSDIHPSADIAEAHFYVYVTQLGWSADMMIYSLDDFEPVNSDVWQGGPYNPVLIQGPGGLLQDEWYQVPVEDYINQGGGTCFLMREYNRDVQNTPPADNTWDGVWMEDQGGNAPYLEVELNNQAPTVPANLRETANTSTTADIAWNASTDYEGDDITYRVQWVVDGAGWGDPNETTSTSPSKTITGLSTGVTYDVRVRAEDEEPLASNWNTELQLFTANSKPPDVTNLAAGDNTSTTADLTWDESVDPDAGGGDQVSYEVQWVVEGTGWGAPNSTPTNNLYLTLEGLAPGTAYDVRVRAYDLEPLYSDWRAGCVVGCVDGSRRDSRMIGAQLRPSRLRLSLSGVWGRLSGAVFVVVGGLGAETVRG